MPHPVAAVLLAALALGGTGCTEHCCDFDSRPIGLQRAELGELVATVSVDQGDPGPALFDTASRVTLLGGPGGIGGHGLRLLSGTATRAVLRDVTMVPGVLGAVGESQRLQPLAVLGGDLLAGLAVEIGFARPELVLWAAQPAPDDFLSQAGFAVLRVSRRGGGQADGPGGSYSFPPSLLPLRVCAAPAAFDPRSAPNTMRCCAGDDRTLATGTDLSLVLGTGFGPVVLARTAWQRITSGMSAPPATVPRPLHLASWPDPVAAEWSTLPRLALVDREAAPTANPGACVELGRARRLELVAIQQSLHPDLAACAMPCDQDGRNAGLAQNSAAYVEVGAALSVAIVDDGEPFFQALRTAVRPDGPEIDGVLGAAALAGARLEIDYRSQPARAIFSCEADVDPTVCRAVGRCPRLSGPGQRHVCFGLPAHGLPAMCDNQGAACQ